MSLKLEKNGYFYAKYLLDKKIYKIFSEPNYENFSIELLDGSGNQFTVKLWDIELIKGLK